ncbi:MAG: hypothetical protein AABY22_33730, partial [Nanoarchaeota archaeon]
SINSVFLYLDLRSFCTNSSIVEPNSSVIFYSPCATSWAILFRSSSKINEMSWTVTQTYHDGGNESEPKDRLQMVGYLTLELNKIIRKKVSDIPKVVIKGILYLFFILSSIFV